MSMVSNYLKKVHFFAKSVEDLQFYKLSVIFLDSILVTDGLLELIVCVSNG